MRHIDINDLAGVVYSSGKVFNGLQTGRLDTANFLRSGNLDGVTSRSDLQLLQDLRDVAAYVVAHPSGPIDADYVTSLNALISRSGAIRAGQLRQPDSQIGVTTPYGRHEPDAITHEDLDTIIAEALSGPDELDNALNLFITLAKAQPFDDGNKRTALFAANGYLIAAGTDLQVTVPVDDADPTIAARFNDALARAYLYDDSTEVRHLMRTLGTSTIGPSPAPPAESPRPVIDAPSLPGTITALSTGAHDPSASTRHQPHDVGPDPH